MRDFRRPSYVHVHVCRSYGRPKVLPLDLTVIINHHHHYYLFVTVLFLFLILLIFIIIISLLAIEEGYQSVTLYGSNGPVWTAVSKFVGTRNSTQCRERYRNVLAGQHLIRPWTENETKKLMEYCNEKLKDGERGRERERERERERGGRKRRTYY